MALESGLARYRPDAATAACRAARLTAEQRGRAAKAGLWGRAGLGMVDPADRKAVAAAPAGMIVVEGVVTKIGEAGGRLYLNFGETRAVDLAITVSRRNISRFDARGLKLRALAGKRLRARGLLDRRFGPQIEVFDPDALELVGDGATEAPPSRTKG